MSNILNHNRNIFDLKLDKSDYWDFHLSLDETSAYGGNKNDNSCLSIEIDFNNPECMWFDNFYSLKESVWPESINNGLTLNSIGFTGIDNGLITYEKDAISNKQFLDIYLNSKYEIESDDMRFHFHKVNGNNQVYDYSNTLIFDNDILVSKLNGGFYQGFFKSGDEYQILPVGIDRQWKISIDLKPCDFENEKYTLNKKHPENKGFFFYIGTRAENKWWKRYLTDFETQECDSKYVEDEYLTDYIYNNHLVNSHYLGEDDTDDVEDIVDRKYVEDGYINSMICNKEGFVDEDYIEPEIPIDSNMEMKTEEGYNLYQPNIREIKTDNKFITYHRGKDGFRANEDNSDKEVVLYDIKTPNIENYFLLFNRTPNGYTTCNIQEYIDVKNKEYDILADLYNNAIGFQIKEDGSIGFKYLIKDCDNGGYKIESLFSKPNIVTQDNWHKVDIQLINTRPVNNKCVLKTPALSTDKMKIHIYVNGKLVLISKELPMLQLRKLNDLDSKQQGVPFNISIGGGTQGLCDTVDINYMTPPSEILPLEQEFGGTFIGCIKNFKFYTC